MSSIQLFFLQKVVRQNDTVLMSLCMQFEKLGHGLLREAFQSEGECFVSLKRGGYVHHIVTVPAHSIKYYRQVNSEKSNHAVRSAAFLFIYF